MVTGDRQSYAKCGRRMQQPAQTPFKPAG